MSTKMDVKQSPIMNESIPDLLLEAELESLSLNIHAYDVEDSNKAFVILDSNENLRITSAESFIKKLGIVDEEDKTVKVISIFGASGDGKSHTMNHVFFDGLEVFKTSSEQNSCTMGVYVSYEPSFNNHPVICIDTEGLLGVGQNENKQQRMLMKVLAISDVIIYRSRSERLNSEMYKFLASASKTFVKHFSPILQPTSASSPRTNLGPDIIIFHETRNTRPLESNVAESAEDLIREKFAEMKLSIDAFNSLKYVGIKTHFPPTDFSKLKSILKLNLENKMRPARTTTNIYQTLQLLNERFSGELDNTLYTFMEKHFTCMCVCESCNERCENTVDHAKEGIEHKNSNVCQYQQVLDNKLYLCKKCHIARIRSVVKVNNSNDPAWLGIAKYAWSMGGIQNIDCQNCGEIYRARWYGNKSPEEICVIAEPIHVWRDSPLSSQTATHSAQIILDGFSYLTETISSVGAQPTKSLSSWVADKIAPTYWRPNSEIIHCKQCKINFSRTGLQIHHCRSCGDGFCSSCSRSRMNVPHRGWNELVRVCNDCRDELLKSESVNKQENPDEEIKNVRVRKYGEVLVSCVSSVASVLEYPKDLIKDSARPSYWVPDSESSNCSICNQLFGNAEDMDKSQFLYSGGNQNSPVHANSVPAKLKLHHCRKCGKAVCNKCSLSRAPVPEKGWNAEVRVCDTCLQN